MTLLEMHYITEVNLGADVGFLVNLTKFSQSISWPPGVAPAPDNPSQPRQLPYPHLQWSQLLQDPVYPGFPQNEKGEVEPLPPFSLSQKGEDLPQGNENPRDLIYTCLTLTSDN